MSGDIVRAVDALRRGAQVLLPTDTVYGLCSSADEDAVRALYRLKGRDDDQPTALVAATVDALLECVPELRGAAALAARTLLPGPYTLVLPNPAARYRWLTGKEPEAIGVRVPVFPEAARRAVDAVGCIVATSANDPGGPDPVTLDDVPQRIRAACAAELDAGALPGRPSTVIDFTLPEPKVIREGAAPSADAIAQVREARARPSSA